MAPASRSSEVTPVADDSNFEVQPVTPVIGMPLASSGSAQTAHRHKLPRWIWSQWWIVTACWWVCAVLVVVLVKHEEHKSMLSAISNLIAGLMVAPFAIMQGCGAIRNHCGPVFAIAVLAALERNLTNSSMYSIGAALKTALHGFNVPFTFLCASLLGADPGGKRCLLQCKCRENLLLWPALCLVTGGSVVAAALKGNWSGDYLGIFLQLGSSAAYACKFTVAKLLLGGGHGSPPPGTDPANVPPSKIQIAFVANPMTGLIALAFVRVFESSWALPSLWNTIGVAVAANGILFFELRLIELTSPLTVSVLAALHNVVIVLYFVVVDKEDFNKPQMAGFAVSTAGSLIYAWAKSQAAARVAQKRDVAVEEGGTSLRYQESAEEEQGNGCLQESNAPQ